MISLETISLTFGFIGCFFVILSFLFQLHQIYKKKCASGTTWGLILSQIVTCILFGSSAGINIYLDGFINLPFFVSNVVLLVLFIVMSYMKYIYSKKDNVVIQTVSPTS